MKKALSIFCIGWMLTACDGADSSFHINNTPPGQPDIAQKPGKCTVDFAKTCWPETIRKITECLEATNDADVFSTDQKFCTNPSGKLVAFPTPADFFLRPFDALHSPINFKVYPNSKHECFNVNGTGQNFTITLTATGEKIEFSASTSSLQFTCLDGQSVKIETKSIDGCAQANGIDFLKLVPGLEVGPFYDKNKVELGWKLRFRGAPDTPDVFKCFYP